MHHLMVLKLRNRHVRWKHGLRMRWHGLRMWRYRLRLWWHVITTGLVLASSVVNWTHWSRTMIWLIIRVVLISVSLILLESFSSGPIVIVSAPMVLVLDCLVIILSFSKVRFTRSEIVIHPSSTWMMIILSRCDIWL